jgi:condensin-2 complex subunit H2
VGHLEDERNDLDEPEGPPNFAQAALLLQNSSNVYSRKVEYLYSLVYAALDDLASSATGVVPKHQRKTADAAIDEFNAFDPDMQFLLLDDVLPTDQTEAGEKINLDDDEDNDYNVDKTRLNNTRLSLGGMSVTRADRSFGNVTEARSIMGSLFQQGDDAGGGSLKLLNGRCDVGDEGILVMPGTALPRSQNSRFDVNLSPAPVDNNDGGMTYDDDQDDGVGFELADNHDLTEGFGAAANDPPVVQQAQKYQTKKNDPWALLDPHDMGPTKARPLRIGVTYRLPEGLNEPPSNTVTGAHTRRRMLPTRKPVDRAAPTVVSIATETFRATVANRRQQRTAAAMMSLDEKDSIEQDGSMNDSSVFHNAVARPRVPIMGLAFGDEFAYIAKAAAKRKAAERRERRKLLAQDPQAIEESGNLFGYDDFDGGDNDSIGGNYDDNVGNTGIASLDNVHATPDAKGGSAYETTNICMFLHCLTRDSFFCFTVFANRYIQSRGDRVRGSLPSTYQVFRQGRGEVRSRDQPDQTRWRMAEQVGPYS